MTIGALVGRSCLLVSESDMNVALYDSSGVFMGYHIDCSCQRLTVLAVLR